MVLRYLIWIFLIRFLMGSMGNLIVFPVSWMFRNWARKRKWFLQTFLWWWLHDGCDYGDQYFLKKYKNRKNFFTAWMWAFRNPIHNFYYSHRIEGDKTNYSGWATIQSSKQDSGLMWRTLKTTDETGVFQDKYGKFIDPVRSVLGKQRIVFIIKGKKYFRLSGAKPKRLWRNLYWVPEYKFGFEHVNWTIQFHPFVFKKSNSRFNYIKILL